MGGRSVLIVVAFWSLFQIDVRGHRIRILSSFVLLPTRSCPDPPRKASNDAFRCTVSLGSPSGPYAMDEEGNERQS
jgi:hypothetical protein